MTDIEIAGPLAAALAAKGYAALTPVQQAVLAANAAGRDLLVSAQTGSGKTVAFGIAIAPEILVGSERLLFADVPLALVVAPTRELALQVARELDWLYADAGAKIATCVGGMITARKSAHWNAARISWWARRGACVTISNANRLICRGCRQRCWMKQMKCLIWGSVKTLSLS